MIRKYICILLFFEFALGSEVFESDVLKIPSSRKRKLQVSNVQKWTSDLSKALVNLAKTATQVDALLKNYHDLGKVKSYNPEKTLDYMANRLEGFLEKRKELAKQLQDSLLYGDSTYQGVDESFSDKVYKCFKKDHHTKEVYKAHVNCIKQISQKNFNFVDARPKDVIKEATETSTMSTTWDDNSTDFHINGTKNPNFYYIDVDTTKSAVHVPTFVYKLNPELLEEIRWSGEILNPIFTSRRKTSYPSASWQFYCSKQGFLRFYPAANWMMEHGTDRERFDMYDCRNSEWFIDGASNAKNILILMDTSGSMFGHRYEVAKETLKTILRKLSENDFFNVITYSNNANFILPYFNDTLVQATFRNKLLIEDYFSYTKHTPENEANLGKALKMAFEVLINVTNKTEQIGCSSAIMLITDGAAEEHQNIFDTYNPDKKIRFFSFLLGIDAEELKNVKSMACKNRGHFSRIISLVDVQEKVQKYIEVMSKSVSKLNQSHVIWTGAYLDRTYSDPKSVHQVPRVQRLVTTVAYPVIINSTFRGVVGVNAPIIDLQQAAAVYMLGANAYSFIVDNNGYVMFHPQHRPWHSPTSVKPNYNSMDIMELEVLEKNTFQNESTNFTLEPIPVNYNSKLRQYLIDGNSSKDLERIDGHREEYRTLFAMEGKDGGIGYSPRRVYKQHNNYYFRAIKSTLMTLGLAVPTTSTHVVEFKISYTSIDFKWFDGNNWKLHPDWNYCRPNDSDSMLTKEEILLRYLERMKATNQVPERCSNYTFLLNRLLFDARSTYPMDSLWISKAQYDTRKGIHLVFLATQSGLTRYVPIKMDDILWEPPTRTVTLEDGTNFTLNASAEQKPYVPFIKQHTRGLDENFYRRAMRFPEGEFLFDVDSSNFVYIKNESETFNRIDDDRSVLISAFRSVYLAEPNKKAPLGVVGFEMLFVSFAETVYNSTGKKCGASLRCYLLDEHGYIIYTSATNSSSFLPYYLGQFFGHAPNISDELYSIHNTLVEPPVPADRAESSVFVSLVEHGFYENLTYTDYQAMCTRKELGETTGGTRRLLTPFYHVAKLMKRIVEEIILIITEYGVWAFVVNMFQVVKATPAASVRAADGPDFVACDKWTPFYLLKQNKTETVEVMHHDVQCYNNEGKTDGSCSINAIASRVQGTNLLFVVLEVKGKEGSDKPCYTLSCVSTQKRFHWPHFGPVPVVHASDKIFAKSSDAPQVKSRYRRSPSVCHAEQVDDKTDTCSTVKNKCDLNLSVLSLLFLIITWFFQS